MKRRRRSTRRPLMVTLIVALAGVVVVGLYFGVASQSAITKYVDQPAPQTLVLSLSSSAGGPYESSNTTMSALLKKAQGAPMMKEGKPIVLYVGADYCPYCAAERWPLILALMRFGNFSNLYLMASSPTDIFPNTPTFTFAHSAYTSSYVEFQAYETQDRAGKALQSLPSNYSSIMAAYGGGIPLIDLANRYVMPGAAFSPGLLSGMDWNQIVANVQSNQGAGVQIRQEANSLTAAMCKITGNKPSSVCGDPTIAGISTTLASAQVSERSTILTIGMPSMRASAWAIVQYAQMAWSTKISTNTR